MSLAPAAALAGVLLALVAAPAPAGQSPEAEKKAKQQAAYVEKREAKLREPWLAGYGWTPDLDAARKRAAAEKKPVFAYFTRSYSTCPKCEQLQGRLLATEGFREFAKGVVLYVHLATRVEGEKDADLLKEREGAACHYVAVLDAEGNFLAEMEEASLDALRLMLVDAEEYRALRALKEPKPIERLRLLGKELDRGLLDGPGYRSKAGAIEGLDAEGEKERSGVLDGIDIDVQLERHRRITTPDSPLHDEIAGIFFRMYKAGRFPVKKRQAGAFYEAVLEQAVKGKDPDAYAGALERMVKALGESKFLEPYYAEKRKELDALRKEREGRKDPPPK